MMYVNSGVPGVDARVYEVRMLTRQVSVTQYLSITRGRGSKCARWAVSSMAGHPECSGWPGRTVAGIFAWCLLWDAMCEPGAAGGAYLDKN